MRPGDFSKIRGDLNGVSRRVNAAPPANGRSRFRFCFTLDTEPDDMWQTPSTYTFEHFKRLGDFHKRLCDAGACPTYLTTSEIAEDESARQAVHSVAQMGNCEIGAHFHTWTRSWPFETPDLKNPHLPAMAHQLGQQTEERMLRYTCESLEEAFGVHPTSYRGGQWSFGDQSPQSLVNCGIAVDSTITPGLSWKDSRHPLRDGEDWRSVSCSPHRIPVPDSDSGLNELIELPVGASVFYPPWVPTTLRQRIPGKVLGRVYRFAGRPYGHRWLRPTHTSVADMKAVLNTLRDEGCPVWVFMIHSSEISPCTPLPTEDKVKSFVDRCIRGIRAAVELGAQPATLTEAGDWVRNHVSNHVSNYASVQ